MLSRRRRTYKWGLEHPTKTIGKHKVLVLTELLRITDGKVFFLLLLFYLFIYLFILLFFFSFLKYSIVLRMRLGNLNFNCVASEKRWVFTYFYISTKTYFENTH